MDSPVARPETFYKLRYAVDAAFAMLAGMQLDVFTPLKDGAMSAEEIARAIGVGPARLRLLLYGLVAAGLLTEENGMFSNTDEAQQFLVKGSPSYMGNRHGAMAMRWVDYFKTAESIRTGTPQAKLDFSNAPPERLESFLRNINASTVPSGRALVEQFDFSSVGSLLDVGCGGGGLAIAVTKARPHIKATGVDLPAVVPIAQKLVNEEGAGDRVNVIAADLLAAPLPGSYDVAVLRSFIQVFSPQDARIILKNVGAAVKAGGTLYIIGQVLDDSRRAPLEAVGFNLTFLNVFDAGESYTESEHREWLSEAGFVDIQRVSSNFAGGNGLMTARKAI